MIVAHPKEKNALRYCLPHLKGRLAAEDVPALFLITLVLYAGAIRRFQPV